MGREAGGTRRAVWPALAAVGAALYPLAPAFLYAMATSRFPAPANALGVAVVAAFPLPGVLLLWKSAGASDVPALRARAAGVLLVVAPTLWVLTGVLAEASGWGAPSRAFAVHLARPLRLAILRASGERFGRLAVPALLTTAILAIALIGSALLAPHAR